MKLVRENSGCNGEDGIKQWRGKHCFRIYGKPEEIDLIDQIEELIGNEVYSEIYVDDVLKVTLWKHKAFDFCCGDRDNGEGCGWIVEMDDVEEFKALWKKHKKFKGA